MDAARPDKARWIYSTPAQCPAFVNEHVEPIILQHGRNVMHVLSSMLAQSAIPGRLCRKMSASLQRRVAARCSRRASEMLYVQSGVHPSQYDQVSSFAMGHERCMNQLQPNGHCR
eukprot:2258185-Amphidinium_carterae.1